MPTLDNDAVKSRYAQEREKRLRADGNAQYVRLAGDLATDPYEPLVERPPCRDHVTVAIVGGGFAGLLTASRLSELGLDDFRVVEKGGGFGGTWYWNRYPGVQCDTASMVYMPLLEETGYMPSEKYAHGPEILDHCERIAHHFDLSDKALFHTVVTDLEWDDEAARWIVRTDRGDEFTAQFVAMGTGPLHVAKLPGIPGIQSFEGHAFHTSRWDYDYTGGDARGAPLDNLGDKRVGVIGTGATSVQVVPSLAPWVEELYVFQRTPSSVDVRDNHPIDPEWFESIATPGWQQRWLENFTANQAMGTAEEDLVQDGWTDVSRRIRDLIASLPPEKMTREGFANAFQEADIEKMSEIRARIDDVVDDPETADALKAWYWQFCKRPCFHDEYLDAFNSPNTHLVDTNGQGVESVTPAGVVAGGREYELDCLIFASGFEVGTAYTDRAGFEVTGRDGRRLSEEWRDGMRTMQGTYVHGFPNAFLVQPFQGGNLISNIPHNLVEAARTIAMIV
ncbi:MAG: NAD(P)/FAD-dependent oxidoreductase, partial [Gemmatimonadetes bacterium]|nr:NAD(P)/FAD-dependent oxidoreductase [Gemmatimonadota bacterium]